jgi:Kef-type K+ transport system membrane component KefB
VTDAWRRVRRPAALLAGVWIVFGSSVWELPDRLFAEPPEAPDVTRSAFSSAQEESGHTEASLEEAEESGHGLEISHVFLVLIAILLMGKLFGEAAERIGQPAVLGELLAGVILGGSLLGVIPASDTPLGEVVHVFAEIGVSILLFEIGLETDLKEMFRVGKEAAAVALIGVVLPFGLGFLYWYTSNPSIGVHPEGIEFWVVAIFVGATLTATSVGITARVLSDLGKMHTAEARIIIGAAVIDDVLGIVILAVVAGLAGGAAVGLLSIGKIFAFAVGFLVLAVVIGNRAAPYLFNIVDRMRVRGVLLVTAVCFALLLAALADLSGSAMIIGAFAAGIILSSTNQFDAVVERIEPVADVFTPIFFVVVGAPVNVWLFVPGSQDFSGRVMTVGLILTVIAIIGKVLAGFVVRTPGMNRAAIGVGMVPRGEVGLIFAAIGLREGILSNAVYSAVLIMVILSTFLVPPILKQLLQRSGGPDDVATAGDAGLPVPAEAHPLAAIDSAAASSDPDVPRH